MASRVRDPDSPGVGPVGARLLAFAFARCSKRRVPLDLRLCMERARACALAVLCNAGTGDMAAVCCRPPARWPAHFQARCFAAEASVSFSLSLQVCFSSHTRRNPADMVRLNANESRCAPRRYCARRLRTSLPAVRSSSDQQQSSICCVSERVGCRCDFRCCLRHSSMVARAGGKANAGRARDTIWGALLAQLRCHRALGAV